MYFVDYCFANSMVAAIASTGPCRITAPLCLGVNVTANFCAAFCNFSGCVPNVSGRATSWCWPGSPFGCREKAAVLVTASLAIASWKPPAGVAKLVKETSVGFCVNYSSSLVLTARFDTYPSSLTQKLPSATNTLTYAREGNSSSRHIFKLDFSQNIFRPRITFPCDCFSHCAPP